YDPASGAQIWSRLLGAGTGAGSVAVGYGRELYAQTSSGKVAALGEGWSPPVVQLSAAAYKVSPRLGGIKVQWIDSGLPLTPTAALPALGDGYLLQRSADGGPWQDIAELPAGTTEYLDTGITADKSYAYRIQSIDPTGNASDFTSSADV